MDSLYSDSAVLIIDELGVEKNTEAVHKLRRTLLDHRYRNATADAMADRALDTRFVALECSKTSYRQVAR